MRVAFVNSVAGFGSTGHIVYDLSRIPGVQGRIYFGRKKNDTDADTFRVTELPGNFRHCVMTFLMDRQGFCNQKETEKMVGNLKEFRPDLVHLHNLHGFYLNCPTLFEYLKESGVPVVWTMHDCWPFTGHCAHYDSLNCTQWKTGCTASCPGALKYPFTFNRTQVPVMYEKKKELFTSLPVKQMTIAAPSSWLGAQLKESFLSAYPVRVIHNGIRLDTFRPTASSFRAEHHLEDLQILLAVASSWDRSKGLEDLRKFSSSLKDHQKLVVVGLRKEQMRGFDTSRSILLERTENVHQLCEIYSSADLLLNLTYEDTFPTVNLEAQACGCPVLTYRTGGSPESITDQTGIVVEKGNLNQVISLVQAMDSGASDQERRACRRNALRFDHQNMLNSYRNLYEERTGIAL